MTVDEQSTMIKNMTINTSIYRHGYFGVVSSCIYL